MEGRAMLRGERVTLRAIERDDLALLWAYNNDLEVELASGGDPPMPQSLARLQAEFDANAAKGGRDGATFGIEVGGKLIGSCGLFGYSETDGHAELGIGIGDKTYWNQGYGREAVRLLLDYAFRLRNWRRVWLRVWGHNERAIRSYRAVGFVEEGRLRDHVWSAGRYYDLVLMGILRDEWQAAQAAQVAQG
jgi:RimJ/RimL family protein N-acetyltransferase